MRLTNASFDWRDFWRKNREYFDEPLPSFFRPLYHQFLSPSFQAILSAILARLLRLRSPPFFAVYFTQFFANDRAGIFPAPSPAKNGRNKMPKMEEKIMAKKTTIWTVTFTFRWTDISFQFTDAEQAAIFAEKAVDNFAPHYSDYYAGNTPQLSVKIDLVTKEEDALKKTAYLEAVTPKQEEQEKPE